MIRFSNFVIKYIILRTFLLRRMYYPFRGVRVATLRRRASKSCREATQTSPFLFVDRISKRLKRRATHKEPTVCVFYVVQHRYVYFIHIYRSVLSFYFLCPQKSFGLFKIIYTHLCACVCRNEKTIYNCIRVYATSTMTQDSLRFVGGNVKFG